MERYLNTTREKISMAQTSTHLSKESSDRIQLIAARTLIRNGEQWGSPVMVRRGWRMLIKVRMRQLGRMAKRSLTRFDKCLLSNRRNLFIQQIEEKLGENNGNQNTTPMS